MDPVLALAANSSELIACSRCSVCAVCAALGARSCFQATTPAIATKGNAPSMPARAKSAGNNARISSARASAMPRLAHHGERNRIANSEFGAIFSFMGVSTGVGPSATPSSRVNRAYASW